MIRRIEISESVIMPQKTVSFAGNDHRHRNLRVDLRQAAGKSLNIQITVLELSRAVNMLSLRGDESLSDSEGPLSLNLGSDD